MSDNIELTTEFRIKSGIDLTDFEFKGKFPKFDSNKQKWGVIGRGTAWKMYAEFLENKLAENNQRHEEQMKERVIKSLLSFAHSGQLPDTFCYTDEEILTGLEKWYNENYGSDE